MTHLECNTLQYISLVQAVTLYSSPLNDLTEVTQEDCRRAGNWLWIPKPRLVPKPLDCHTEPVFSPPSPETRVPSWPLVEIQSRPVVTERYCCSVDCEMSLVSYSVSSGKVSVSQLSVNGAFWQFGWKLRIKRVWWIAYCFTRGVPTLWQGASIPAQVGQLALAQLELVRRKIALWTWAAV